MGAPLGKDKPISPVSAPEVDPSPSSLEHFSGLLQASLSVHITEDHVQSLLTLRRGREELFGAELFSDPAWDIVLELYGARLGGHSVRRSDLARSLKAPRSAITRWVAALIEAGHVEADPIDPERVELSDSGAAKMAQLVDRFGAASLAISRLRCD